MVQHTIHIRVLRNCGLAAAFCLSLAAQSPQGADTTTVNSQRHRVDVRQGTVIHAVGNNLLVKMKDGSVRYYVIPEDQTFNIDGKQVKTNDLKAGTRLMQVITTTTSDVTLSSIRNVDLRVIQVMPPKLNVQMEDGAQKLLTVPEGTIFEIDGKQLKLTDLQEGMRVKGTVVIKTPDTVVSRGKKTIGVAPVEIPTIIGVVLLDERK